MRGTLRQSMTIPRFKLYHYQATRSARVKWMLHEVVDDEYLEKNPNHCVPTLEITTPDGRSMHMIESGAMVTFLADAFPDKGLAPPSSGLRARRRV